jgi:hypothetical protein
MRPCRAVSGCRTMEGSPSAEDKASDPFCFACGAVPGIGSRPKKADAGSWELTRLVRRASRNETDQQGDPCGSLA